MNTPRVSIVITCYNYGNYVAEAIESSLNQTYDNLDILVIDDGSTDTSLSVIRQYKEKINIISQKNKGIVYTRNKALRLVDSEYICFLDADDYFDHDYIENMVRVALENDADVVYPNWRIFGDKEYTKLFPEFDLQKLVIQDLHCTSESLIRLSAIGGHRFESEKVAEDWDFFLGLALQGCKFKLARQCYINYRVKSGGRGTVHPYWDDMYDFFSILQKWHKKYPKKITPLDLPVHAGRLRDEHIRSQEQVIKQKESVIQEQDGIIREKDRVISNQDEVIAASKSTIADLEQEIRSVRTLHGDIIGSRAYKVGNKIAYPARITKRALSLTRRTTGQVRIRQANKSIERTYASQLSLIDSGLDDVYSKKFAVVIHMYYPETWTFFLQKLSLLPRDKFDLFITIPEANVSFIDEIKKAYPQAHALISPNRGRDILPFLKIINVIYEKNYCSVLKFHTKKSTHWDGGQDWMNTMLDEIIPDSKKAMKEVIKVATGGEQFGVIGPSSVYYPLTINYPANANHLATQLAGLYDEQTAQEIATNRKDYGFFGGSMIWIDRYVIEKLLRFDNIEFFEPEAGQVDGTFAHAIERLISLIPEIEGKDIFESDSKALSRREYPSDNIPEWSEDHDK